MSSFRLCRFTAWAVGPWLTSYVPPLCPPCGEVIDELTRPDEGEKGPEPLCPDDRPNPELQLNR